MFDRIFFIIVHVLKDLLITIYINLIILSISLFIYII